MKPMVVKSMISKAVLVVVAGGTLALAGCSKNGDGDTKTPPQAKAPTPPPAAPAEIAPPPAAARPAADTANAPTPASRAETDSYIAEVLEPSEIAAGNELAVKVVVKPKGHWHFNLDFPTSVTVEAPSDASVARPKQSLKDAVASSEEEGATWEVKLTPTAPGAKTFKADLKFAVCTETTCDPKKQTLAFELDVK